jgi:hypothetical protein
MTSADTPQPPTSIGERLGRLARRYRDQLLTIAAGGGLLVGTSFAAGYAADHPDSAWAVALAWVAFLAGLVAALLVLGIQQNRIDRARAAARRPAGDAPPTPAAAADRGDPVPLLRRVVVGGLATGLILLVLAVVLG